MVGYDITPHPYTYMPAKVVRNEDGTVQWFDLETNMELPPYFGMGADAQEKVDAWYRSKQVEGVQ